MPVMFFVDDEAVANLHGTEPAEAVASLVAAVRGKLSPGKPRQLFSRIESEARRWKISGGEPQPPFLTLLAIAVLAATRMRRTRERAAHNYYQPFRELLGVDVDVEELKVSTGDALPYLWQCLQWWLDHKHRGRLGFSTIVGGYFYYSYADSQTLFSSSDRDKLTQFFRWIRLKPGERVDQSELMTYFRIWASRRDDLSEGTAHMLESDDYSAQLAQIIKAAADRWRGVVREDGHRGAEILLTLALFPRPQLGLVAERPDGLPAELTCRGPIGSATTFMSSCEGWYDNLSLDISRQALDVGLHVTATAIKFRLPAYNVHVLAKNADLGKWASVPQLSPGEPAWLLVRRNALEAVSAYLRRSARRGWKVIERDGVAPRGWHLVGEVTIDAVSDEQPPEGLARIVPRVHNRFSLKGGLPLPRGSAAYLTTGEPDVWLPPPSDDRGGSVELRLDGGEALAVPPSVGRVRLADHGLGEGAHMVEMEGIGRSFSTVRTLGQLVPRPDRSIAHALRRGEHGPEVEAPSARGVDGPPTTGEIRVSGAIVEDPGASLGERPLPPLVLPVGALRCVVIGARPGQIDEVAPPTKPPWMDRAGLNFERFEFVPRFPVVWIINEWRSAPTLRIRLKQLLPPLPAARETPEHDLQAWARALASAPAPADPTAAELWTSYQACGSEVSFR